MNAHLLPLTVSLFEYSEGQQNMQTSPSASSLDSSLSKRRDICQTLSDSDECSSSWHYCRQPTLKDIMSTSSGSFLEFQKRKRYQSSAGDVSTGTRMRAPTSETAPTVPRRMRRSLRTKRSISGTLWILFSALIRFPLQILKRDWLRLYPDSTTKWFCFRRVRSCIFNSEYF